jgi:hypothetical protein
VQAPPSQISPLSHSSPLVPMPAVPQLPLAPQCVGSLIGSTQTPPQFTRFAAQDRAHSPPEQT